MAAGEPDAIYIDLERWRSLVPVSAWSTGFAESGMVLWADVFGVADGWRAGTVLAVRVVTAR